MALRLPSTNASLPDHRPLHRLQRSRGLLRPVALAALLLGCRSTASEPPDLAASPQAKAEPAPLANVPTAAGASLPTVDEVDAGPPPEPLRTDEPLPVDVPRELVREVSPRDGGAGKEIVRDSRESGVSLQAVLRTGEGPGAPRAPEVNAAAIEVLRRKTETRLAIDVGFARARFELSGAFVLPSGTELRARSDRYGHLLLWPGESTYRVVAPGALRALLGERRLDVAPLSLADVHGSGEGPHRLGMRTRRVDVTTRAAKAVLELATIPGAGEGGILVCRFLLDLMSAASSTRACAGDDVPLHAELHWTTRGALTFDVVSINRRVDFTQQDLMTPSSSLAFTVAPLPNPGADLLVARSELGSFRTGPVDVPPPVAHDAQAPPDSGLLLVNSSDELRVAWIDAVPAAWVGPGARLALPSMIRGRYLLQWRTVLGDGWEAPDLLIIPGVSEVGAPVR
jgi:hypothetical protein